MLTDLISDEPNTYRRIAIIDVSHGVDVEYNKHWYTDKASWLVCGQFVWNIDSALNRKRVRCSKDEIWVAPEYVDDECISDKEGSKLLYQSIDTALLTRLFSLKRIERKLAGVT